LIIRHDDKRFELKPRSPRVRRDPTNQLFSSRWFPRGSATRAWTTQARGSVLTDVKDRSRRFAANTLYTHSRKGRGGDVDHGMLVSEPMITRGSKRRWFSSAAVMTALVLGCVTIPLHATEHESRVLILNGVDPYLPVYLATDAAMRESLASESERRVVFLSESIDAQRFSMKALEPELLGLLARKYRALNIDAPIR